MNPPDSVEVPAGHLLLQTVRSHDQFNTTVYGLNDRYRGIKGGRRVVFVNPTTCATADCTTAIWSTWSACGRTASAGPAGSGPCSTRRRGGCAAAYFPEANVLVPLDSTAVGSNTPTSKSIVIRVEAAAS